MISLHMIRDQSEERREIKQSELAIIRPGSEPLRKMHSDVDGNHKK